MIHTKIGNGYGGYEHPAGETACGLPGRGKRFSKGIDPKSTGWLDNSDVTCPECAFKLYENFGEFCNEHGVYTGPAVKP